MEDGRIDGQTNENWRLYCNVLKQMRQEKADKIRRLSIRWDDSLYFDKMEIIKISEKWTVNIGQSDATLHMRQVQCKKTKSSKHIANLGSTERDSVKVKTIKRTVIQVIEPFRVEMVSRKISRSWHNLISDPTTITLCEMKIQISPYQRHELGKANLLNN